MRRKPIQHHIDGLAALLLFGVFAVCILVVLFTGADAYRRLAEKNFDQRSCNQYIATKVRQADRSANIAVGDIQGTQTLILDVGLEYVTYIYCYDGWLWELYTWSEEPPLPGDGQMIVPVDQVEWSLEDGLLTVQITMPDGETSTLLLSLRSGEGAGL